MIYLSSEMGWTPDYNPLADRFEAMITGQWRSQDLRWGTIDPRSVPILRQWFEWFPTMQGNLIIVPSRTQSRDHMPILAPTTPFIL